MALRVNGYAVDHIEYNGAIITNKPQRLKTCDIDIPNGSVEYSLEGSDSTYNLSFVIEGDTITYIWPDGFTCRITITGDVSEQ